MNPKRIVFAVLGCVCLALGCIGIALPVLPTVPFFLATVFFFAKSSRRLHDWFISTGMYRRHLESYVQKKGMRMKTKLAILGSVTLVMGIGVVLMLRRGIYVPSILLGVVWVGHILYFLFGVRTLPEAEASAEAEK